MQRGEIWWATLPEPTGSGPGYRRPVLVIQSDDFNRSRIATVIVLVVTSNAKLALAPGNVLLSRRAAPRRAAGLPQDSVANVSQLITIDKRLLTEQAGTLPAKLLRQIEAGLRLILVL
jgi:mRNA interferase MazF